MSEIGVPWRNGLTIVRTGTDQYRQLLGQHAEAVALKGVRVMVSSDEVALCRDWAQRCWENRGRPNNRPPGSGDWMTDDHHWLHMNYLGSVATRAVQRVIGGTVCCTPDQPDEGYDLEKGGQKYDVKHRQAFLTPRMICREYAGTIGPPEPDIRVEIPHILVNPISQSNDVLVCGVIDRARFLLTMFHLQLNRYICTAVTAQPLQSIREL